MPPAVGGAAAWALEELGGARLPAERGAPARQPAAELRLADEEQRAAGLAAERERAATEAYSGGYADGEKAGRAAEAARLRTLVTAAEAAVAALREGESRWTGQIEENIAALAVAVARHVIGREIAGDAPAITDLVRRALAEFPIDQPVAIRLHPGDLATLATVHAPAGATTGGGTGMVAPNRDARWIADPQLIPGGCLVEGRDRIIDGRVDTGLERLYRRLSGTNA